MSRKRYTVACLTGNGVGPELIGEASRALEAASGLHGFVVDEDHVPFGADALMRLGHPYPTSSRHSVLGADAVLVAPGTDEPLDAIEDELDLRASVVRLRFDGRSELSILAPLQEDSWGWTLRRAFAIARAGRAHVALVGTDAGWAGVADRSEADHDGFAVERLSRADAVRALVATPQRFDVVVCAAEFALTAAEVAACTARRRFAAWGQLAESGPGLFGAHFAAGRDMAGHGVADPGAMLLAAALMLGEGLGERVAAATLSRAVGRADVRGRGPSTRELGDAVLAAMPLGLDLEFREAV